MNRGSKGRRGSVASRASRARPESRAFLGRRVPMVLRARRVIPANAGNRELLARRAILAKLVSPGRMAHPRTKSRYPRASLAPNQIGWRACAARRARMVRMALAGTVEMAEMGQTAAMPWKSTFCPGST